MGLERFDKMAGRLPRAPRYPLRLRAQYRRTPTDSWHEATTINMSRSGVLFSTTEPVPRETTLELRIQLALDQTKVAPAFGTIECHCRIVRAEPQRAAAIIERYTLRRGAL